MNEPPELPPLYQTTLDADGLARLFADLTAAAEVWSVQAKADPRRHADANPLTLESARDRLIAGAVAGVQVRYRYDGREWTDTVLRTPAGFRVVRMEVPAG